MNKVSIYGGLGNQMFQYAFCIAMNQKDNKTGISFSNFLFYNHHTGFNLTKAFKIDLPIHLKVLNLILQFGRPLYKKKISAYFLKRLIDFYHYKRYKIYKEKKEFEFDENVFNQKSSFFVGIWQVEAYFKNIESIIHQTFFFKTPKDKKNIKLIENINTTNSVSIHIRRGDYYNSHWREILGIIKNNTYYEKAIVYIEKKVQNPYFFIFSDDIHWAKANIKISNCTFVDHNKGVNSYIDMYLMSLCKHNIITNSTFSWWGGWLNNNRNKIVIMPGKWINKESSPGIFPNEWIKLNYN